MSIYRVTYRGEGFELYEVEADSAGDARAIVEAGLFPVQTYVESSEFDQVEVIEE